MKISFNWIQDYVDLPEGILAMEVGERLTRAGLEVEGIQKLGEDLRDVIVARVERVAKHPNADSLSLCVVDTGTQKLNVVCGASNVREGIKVALAQVGVTLPNGMTLKKSKIRGESSEGMICSEVELGLAENSTGIMILDGDLELGASLSKALQLEDSVFDIAVTPNRADCLGHLGVAREIAGLYGLKCKLPEIFASSVKGQAELQIQILAPKACGAYLGRKISGITMAPSSVVIQNRLKAVGLRPINQVVDATNYVLMELGQPTHAFDARFVKSLHITVRLAKKGESISLLDGKPCVLSEDDLLICDSGGPIALAGVMGGEGSQIRENTQDLVLECAYFDPGGIRRTSRHFGIRTESSYRFERGVDPFSLEFAMGRLTHLIVNGSKGGQAKEPIVQPLVIKKSDLGRPTEIRISKDFINRRLGTAFTAVEIEKCFDAIGLKKLNGNQEESLYQIPSYRQDLKRPIDLVEEVARLRGYDAIPVTLPKPKLKAAPEVPSRQLTSRVSEALVAGGFSEAIHYSFVSEADLKVLGLKDSSFVVVKNPLTPDQAVLRRMLLPGLLRAVAYNLNRDSADVRLFECGKVFERHQDPQELSKEKIALGGVMTGHRAQKSWNQEFVRLDFFDLKGVLENIGVDFNFVGLEGSQQAYPFLHPGESASLLLHHAGRAVEVGFCGAVHPQILSHFEIQETIWAFELDLEALLPVLAQERPQFVPLSAYPAVHRDLAILVPKETLAQSIYELIFSLKNKIIEEVQVFDVYEGEQIPRGKKSMAFRIGYLSRERTLTQEEVERVHQKVLKELEKSVGAEIRSA